VDNWVAPQADLDKITLSYSPAISNLVVPAEAGVESDGRTNNARGTAPLLRWIFAVHVGLAGAHMIGCCQDILGEGTQRMSGCQRQSPRPCKSIKSQNEVDFTARRHAVAANQRLHPTS